MAAPATERPPDTGEQRDNPFTKKWFIVSAVVVGLVVVLGLYLLVIGPYRPQQQAHRPGQGTSAPAPVRSACGLRDGTQVPPVVTPIGTHWQLVGTMAAPSDPAVGPAGTREGVPTCYAPTPLGALYAATNYVAATTAVELRAPAARVLCAAGPGRDAALADIAANPGNRTSGVQIAGFQFIGYVPASSATVDLAVRTGAGGLAHFPLALVFIDGDWRIQLPVTGSPYGAVQSLPTLGGYVTWSGA